MQFIHVSNFYHQRCSGSFWGGSLKKLGPKTHRQNGNLHLDDVRSVLLKFQELFRVALLIWMTTPGKDTHDIVSRVRETKVTQVIQVTQPALLHGERHCATPPGRNESTSPITKAGGNVKHSCHEQFWNPCSAGYLFISLANPPRCFCSVVQVVSCCKRLYVSAFEIYLHRSTGLS